MESGRRPPRLRRGMRLRRIGRPQGDRACGPDPAPLQGLSQTGAWIFNQL